MADVQVSYIESLLELDRDSADPLYAQLYQSLRSGIVNGKLPQGTRLPATRVLANELGISRNTAIKAFDQLRSEGYLDSRVGSGTFVSESLPERHTEVRGPSTELDHSLQLPDLSSRSPTLSKRADQLAQNTLSLLDDPIDQSAFRPGVPAFDAFPIETWSKLASRRWRTVPPSELVYGDPAGFPSLRQAVAEYLRTARGARCEAEQVIIVSGVQQAFTLVARVLLNPDDSVVVEDPGFPRMRAAFAAAGARVRSVPVDEHGFDVSAVKTNSSHRMVGITPSHQYPLGTTMSLPRRLELLKWSAANNVWILEDDYDSEYRYSGQPIAALQGMDNSGRVLYTGTFSKVLFPALRLGYLVVPPGLVEPITKMRTVSDRCPPRVTQMILTDFITEGHFQEHIRQMRTLYAARQNALLDAINEELDDFIDINPSNAGLHLVGRLPKEVDDRAVSDRLAEHDIIALPLSFYAERSLDRGGLLLGYAAVPEDTIRSKVRRMAKILEPFRP